MQAINIDYNVKILINHSIVVAAVSIVYLRNHRMFQFRHVYSVHNSSTIKHRIDRISIRENILLKMNQKKKIIGESQKCEKEPQTTNPPLFRCNTHGLFVMLLNSLTNALSSACK